MKGPQGDVICTALAMRRAASQVHIVDKQDEISRCKVRRNIVVCGPVEVLVRRKD